MEPQSPVRIVLGKQSSLAAERNGGQGLFVVDTDEVDEVMSDEVVTQDVDEVDPRVRLMYCANESDLEGMCELLDQGVDVNFRDVDDRTALHIAACQGFSDAVGFLLDRGARVDSKDRWGSTPLADAIYYKNHDVIKLLEKYGAKHMMAPMHVNNARDVPEYEISSKELDFTNSVDITKGTFRKASWRGIEVAVKILGDEFFVDEDKVRAFTDELALLQKLRHPNIVQFLGAVTQSSPMMIVTEYLPKGDLRACLNRKGPLKPETAVLFALDIARGMNYLHENKPPVIHRDLEPSNILRDDCGHLKVADFGVSKLLKVANRDKDDKTRIGEDTRCIYVAPEVFTDGDYDTKVDVYSFALILQEMIEGHLPYCTKQDVSKSKTAKHRPPFRSPAKHYAHGLRGLIEDCWSENPLKRPTFKQIIVKLESIYQSLGHKRRWKIRPLKCFQDNDPSNTGSSSSLSPTPDRKGK